MTNGSVEIIVIIIIIIATHYQGERVVLSRKWSSASSLASQLQVDYCLEMTRVRKERKSGRLWTSADWIECWNAELMVLICFGVTYMWFSLPSMKMLALLLAVLLFGLSDSN